MTTLTATRYVHATTGVVAARLDVTSAPEPPSTRYASNFTAGVDGWAIVSGTGTLTPSTFDPGALRLTAADGTDAVQAGRTVTGLTIGASYRFSVDVKRDAGQVTAVVTGLGGTGYTVTFSGGFTTLTKDFTATATSHEIKVAILRSGGTWSTRPDYTFTNATVTGPTGTWRGTTITRTDANGTATVRNPRGYDTTGTDLSLIDYDAALAGSISYTVTDGLGGTATATVTAGRATDTAWLTLPTTGDPGNSTYPAASLSLFKITSWDAGQDTIGRTHQIIGRTNKIGNPGPLALRTGTFDVLCLAYADVKALRDLLDGGDVAMLRQPTHPGLDLYFLTQHVAVRMDPDSQTWTVTVTFDEVQRP